MPPIEEGTLLWSPTPEVIDKANMTHYMRWLEEKYGLQFSGYDDLWRWSVAELETFWQTMYEYLDVHFTKEPSAILGKRTMPGAEWFVGAELNYAQNIFRRMTDEHPMLLFQAEDQPLQAISWQHAYDQVNRLVALLRSLGVQRGDRVVAYLPNRPEAVFALMAAASIGAIWSSCAPDFGAKSVLDRFSQIEPKVLFTVDGYNYGGKTYDRRDVLATLQEALPTLQQTILVPHISESTEGLRDTVLWEASLAAQNPPDAIPFESLPFDHPLWVLYSSGTTGLPKPIVQGHGGIVLEHMKVSVLHSDLKPGDRFFWYSSTGWMMWNYVVGSLFAGSTPVLYDGSAGYPDMNSLWRLAEQARIKYFGTSAAYINACIKADIHPNQEFDLSAIQSVGSTGSPLTPMGFQWVYDNVNQHLSLESVSGGTDVCTLFVGGTRLKPVYAGEIQCAAIGIAVRAYNDDGEEVIDEVGELVITEPIPSMPLFFWDDPNMERYKSSYFDTFPGVWRHGDWIKFNERGGCVIYGRSDSTINRQGIRMGTSEIYRAVEALPEVLDSLIVDLELLGRKSYMPLFVVLREGVELDDDLKQRIKQTLRENVSPRHVPNEIFAIDEVPYTLSGKKMEVPVRKILLGMDASKTANRGAMRNPGTIDYFLEFAEKLNEK